GAFVDVQSQKVLGDALPGESFALEVEVKNVGVGATAQNVIVEVEALTAGVNVSGPSNYGSVIRRARANNSGDPFTISLDTNIEETIIRLRVNTYQDGTLNDSLEIPVYLGEKDVYFFDDASSGASQWTAEGDGIPWGTVTDDAYSGTTCFGDSDGGNGMNHSLNSFELNQTFDFTGTLNPAVSFVAKYSIEGNDFVDFQISTDDGETWEALERFVNAEPWEPYFYSLINFRDETAVKFRFFMDTNGVIPADGFYFDDFEVANYSEEFLGDQNVALNKFKVYPNPFDGQLTIAGQTSDAFTQVVLYDLQGRVLQKQAVDAKNEVQLSGLETLNRGVYFIKVRTVSGSEGVRKIVKF
ncbi:MAG: T9SS type A sorting domain-containing protein, partial [Bacteroidota bacterium]